jgi:hypothetical protein
MRTKDISTAIQGHLWIIQNTNDPATYIQSITELQYLRTQISKDKVLNGGPRMIEINKALAAISRHVVVEYEDEHPEPPTPASSVCASASLWILGVSVIGTYVYGLSTLLLS